MKHSATRALALLEAMNLRPVSAVRDLAAATGISKPSVVRLLAILMEDGFVQRAGKPGTYSLTRKVQQLSAGFRDDSAIARTAGPVMESLTRRWEWPTALGMLEQGAMVVRYSTIPASPIAWYHTTLYHRLPLLEFAMGLVYLAFSPPSVRAALLSVSISDEIAAAERSEERFRQIRDRGYALRAPTPAHPTLSISVPLMLGDRVLAALSMTLFGRAMPSNEAVTRYFEPLRDAAHKIVTQCDLT